MKAKNIFIVLIALVLIACNPTRQVTQTKDVIKKTINSTSHIKAETKTEVLTNTEKAVVEQKALEQIWKESTNTEAILVTYDTNKPIDTTTGRPPIKSELKIKKNG